MHCQHIFKLDVGDRGPLNKSLRSSQGLQERGDETGVGRRHLIIIIIISSSSSSSITNTITIRITAFMSGVIGPCHVFTCAPWRTASAAYRSVSAAYRFALDIIGIQIS